MHEFVRVMLLALMFAGGAAVMAQGPTYRLGKAPTAAEIKAADTLVDQEGTLLPAGRGTPQEGASLYAQRCAMCHGPNGEGTNTPAGTGPVLIHERRGIRHMHFATTLWSYIYRAMPMHQERTLTVDQAYALSAFLLARNGIIDENEEMNQDTLPKVDMPARDEWSPPPLTSG